jgi:hypothetical protein
MQVEQIASPRGKFRRVKGPTELDRGCFRRRSTLFGIRSRAQPDGVRTQICSHNHLFAKPAFPLQRHTRRVDADNARAGEETEKVQVAVAAHSAALPEALCRVGVHIEHARAVDLHLSRGNPTG